MDVTRSGETFVVDAAVLAAAFALPEDAVREAMSDGRISAGCEMGMGEDAGRWRLTFRHGGRTLRLVVDAEGTVLARSRISAAPGHGSGGAND